MANQQRARFLTRASQHLFATSPSTSAHLSSEHIAFSRSTQNRMVIEQACGGCGTLAVHGVTTSTVPKKKFPGHGPKNAKRTDRPRSMRTSCHTCRRVTKRTLSVAPKPKRHSLKSTTAEIVEKPVDNPPALAKQSTSDVKTNSKKRAKARKDREGLRALLDKPQESSMRPNLSLMDFRKH